MAGHLLLLFLLTMFSETYQEDLAAPKLSVDPEIITKAGSVRVVCQTPVPGAHCYYTFEKLPAKNMPCDQTLSGSELLTLVGRVSTGEVDVTCFYLGATRSPQSMRKVISVRGSRPEVIVEVITDQVVIICSLPEAAKSASTCYLYFGESPQPYFDKDVQKNLTKAKRQICTFLTSLDELEKKFYTLKTKEISCDYSSVHGHKSARSDGYNMSAFIKNAPVTQPHVTQPHVTQPRVTQPHVTQPLVTTAVSEPVKTTNPSHVTGSETTASSSALPPSTLMRSVLILVVHTVTAFILLLALSFCCTRILVKCDEKCSQEEFKSGGINSEDPNCEALVMNYTLKVLRWRSATCLFLWKRYCFASHFPHYGIKLRHLHGDKQPLSEVNHLNTPAASTVYCSPGYSFKQSSVSDDPSQAEMDNSTN